MSIYALFHECGRNFATRTWEINESEKYRGSGYACQKIKVELQQLMAGSRNFKISTISRNDLMALTEEAANISGIP